MREQTQTNTTRLCFRSLCKLSEKDPFPQKIQAFYDTIKNVKTAEDWDEEAFDQELYLETIQQLREQNKTRARKERIAERLIELTPASVPDKSLFI